MSSDPSFYRKFYADHKKHNEDIVKMNVSRDMGQKNKNLLNQQEIQILELK